VIVAWRNNELQGAGNETAFAIAVALAAFRIPTRPSATIEGSPARSYIRANIQRWTA
jgi:hypothetical protein